MVGCAFCGKNLGSGNGAMGMLVWHEISRHWRILEKLKN